MATGRRPARISESIRNYLATVLVRDFTDPRLSMVTLTRVEVPPDLSIAHVYIRLFVGGEDAKARREVVAAAVRATGRLRRGLGPVLGVRRVPELRFHYDEAPDATERIETLLREIESEQSKREP